MYVSENCRPMKVLRWNLLFWLWLINLIGFVGLHVLATWKSMPLPNWSSDIGQGLIAGSLTLFLALRAWNGFGEFKKRNIIGYNLWIFLDKPCSCREHWQIICQSFLRGEVKYDTSTALVIPLGGWFNRPKLWFKERDDTDGNSINMFWRLSGFGKKDEWFSYLTDEKYSFVHLTLNWRDQSRIVFTVPEIIKYLEFMLEHGLKPSTPPTYMISDAIRTITKNDERIEGLGVIKDRLAAEKAVLEKHCETLETMLREAAKRLNATKRFVKSKEGAALREWIDSEMAKLPPARKKEPENGEAA